VKHFKYEPRGKRRIHQKPNAGEIEKCRWWVEQELALIKPALVVAMGATAVKALTGRTLAITRERGRVIAFPGNRSGLVTVHPSYLLRLPEEASRAREYARFVEDLRLAADHAPAIRAAA
jgi:uracil-DNA glycosylase family 4